MIRIFRSISIAAMAALSIASSAIAQERPPELLNRLEVQQLVARAEPADDARLGAHFEALADKYAADARRHMAMSKSFVGNPSRNIATGMSAHCTQLADLNMKSATTLHELAEYHRHRAEGTAGAPPRDAARFQGGAGAPDPTHNELKALAGNARTTADHRALQEYFNTLAKRYTAEANEHVALAQAYRGTRISQAAVHHDRLARLSRDEAKEANDAAEMHRQLAGVS